MTDETSMAFDTPMARAVATGGNDPLDRIAVRDFTKEVEIGAFQSERGVTQRVRFNIVLEVSRSAAAQFDDVDQVLSYDTITEAIEHQLAVERVNLLETLAERIADEILLNPRAVRTFIRIEKLDRIPGTLGIDIVRSRNDDDNIRPIAPNVVPEVEYIHPLVIFMPNTVLYGDQLTEWLDAVANADLPAIICLEKAPVAEPKADVVMAHRRIELLSIEQNAWVLAGKDKRCVVVDSRTELDWATKNGQLSVWAPSKMVLDAVEKPDAGADEPLALARWFAAEFSADNTCILEGFEGAKASETLQITKTPADL